MQCLEIFEWLPSLQREGQNVIRVEEVVVPVPEPDMNVWWKWKRQQRPPSCGQRAICGQEATSVRAADFRGRDVARGYLRSSNGKGVDVELERAVIVSNKKAALDAPTR